MSQDRVEEDVPVCRGKPHGGKGAGMGQKRLVVLYKKQYAREPSLGLRVRRLPSDHRSTVHQFLSGRETAGEDFGFCMDLLNDRWGEKIA
jgi:hypothetical protein